MITIAYYRNIKRSWQGEELGEAVFDIYSELFTNSLFKYKIITPTSMAGQASIACVSRFTLTGLAYPQLCKNKFWEF